MNTVIDTAPRHRLAALATISAATIGAVALGTTVTRPATQTWFAAQRKPSFNPPNEVFGPVWATMYTLGALSAYRVYTRTAAPGRNVALGWWGAQLAFNAAWSPLFFGAHRKKLALLDLGLLLGSLAMYERSARRVDATAARMVWPYLAWVTFAGVLNAEFVRRNR